MWQDGQFTYLRTDATERGMRDNGSGCVSRLFTELRRTLRLRCLRTRPYTPQSRTLRKALQREWGRS